MVGPWRMAQWSGCAPTWGVATRGPSYSAAGMVVATERQLIQSYDAAVPSLGLLTANMESLIYEPRTVWQRDAVVAECGFRSWQSKVICDSLCLVNRFARAMLSNHGKELVSAGHRACEAFAKIRWPHR